MKTIEQLTKADTSWYSSNDEEIWSSGPYATREEAEACAEDEDHRLITRATKAAIRIALYFDQGTFFEAADEALYDANSGELVLDFAPDVNLDLQVRVRAAIDEWQVAHQLAPVPWRFDDCDKPMIAAWAQAEDQALAESAAAIHGDQE